MQTSTLLIREQTSYSDGLDALRRMQDVQDEIKRKSSQLLSRALNISIVHYCVNVSIRSRTTFQPECSLVHD